jgi:hypothetical protein
MQVKRFSFQGGAEYRDLATIRLTLKKQCNSHKSRGSRGGEISRQDSSQRIKLSSTCKLVHPSSKVGQGSQKVH